MQLDPQDHHRLSRLFDSPGRFVDGLGQRAQVVAHPRTRGTSRGRDAPISAMGTTAAPAAAAGKPRPAKRRQSGSYTAEDWEQEAQAQARRPPAPPAVAAPLPRKPGQIAKTMSRANPSLMMNMAVLMEEDEETQIQEEVS